MTTTTTMARAGLVAGALAFAGALLLPGTASAADPLANPLLQSTCSFDQVDRAAHAADSRLAAQLDAYPREKAELRQAFDRPPAERVALARQFVAQNPQLVQRVTSDPRYAEFEGISQRVADTCHNF